MKEFVLQKPFYAVLLGIYLAYNLKKESILDLFYALYDKSQILLEKTVEFRNVLSNVVYTVFLF